MVAGLSPGLAVSPLLVSYHARVSLVLRAPLHWVTRRALLRTREQEARLRLAALLPAWGSAVTLSRLSEAPLAGTLCFFFFLPFFYFSPIPRLLPAQTALRPPASRGRCRPAAGRKCRGPLPAASPRRSGCWGSGWPRPRSARSAPPSPPWAGSPGEGDGVTAGVADGQTRSGARGFFE